MDNIVRILKAAAHVLEIAWDLSTDEELAADIEQVQVDLQKVIDRIQTDLDRERVIGGK